MNNLKAGVYLQVGDSVKGINLATASLSDVFGDVTSESVIGAVAWVRIALNARQERMVQIPYDWELNKKISDDLPVVLDFSFSQIDEALQLYSTAYLHKVRGAGTGKTIKLRWLDPRTMTPNYTRQGITHYKRQIGGQIIDLPVDDVIRIYLRGMGEQTPASSISAVTQVAAEILYYSEKTHANVYKNNALPLMLLYVPAGTAKTEKDTLKSYFANLLNRGKGGDAQYRVVPVTKEVKIERLSFAPDELATKETTESARDEILGSHGVPLSEVLGNSANYATAENETRKFISTIGGRLSIIADFINADDDMIKARIRMIVKTETHPDMQRNDESVSKSLNFYANVMTPRASAYLVGIDESDFPDDFGDPFLSEVKENLASPILSEKTKLALSDLSKWQTKALRVKGAAEFHSDILDSGMILSVRAGLKMASGEEEIKSVFATARKRLVDNGDTDKLLSAMNKNIEIL